MPDLSVMSLALPAWYIDVSVPKYKYLQTIFFLSCLVMLDASHMSLTLPAGDIDIFLPKYRYTIITFCVLLSDA